MNENRDDIPTYTNESDTLEERIKAFEKEKKGLINDLQSEREKRQALEGRLSQIENSLSEAANDNGEEKPEDRVNRLAQDPDGYIDARVTPKIREIEESVKGLLIAQKVERAKKWIAKKEGIDPDDVESKFGDDLIRIGKTRGLVSLDPEEGIKASYEILLQERKEKERKESERDQVIAGHSTERVQSAPSSGGSRFTREGILKMSPEEFNRNFEKIKEAERRGLIK